MKTIYLFFNLNMLKISIYQNANSQNSIGFLQNLNHLMIYDL